MIDGPFLGVILHSGGGVAHGTFYAPLHKVKKWSWESGWLVQGFVAWVIVPWVVAFCFGTNPVEAFSNSSRESIVWTYLFGVMWGFGSLTFGLTMRYLGMSLGMAVALGFCMTFGTLIPPAYEQFFGNPESGNVTITVLLTTRAGAVTLAGIAVCLLGIGQCGYAGMRKERELTDEQKKEGIKEFALGKGFLVAVFSGIMSAGFAYAITVGKPIAEAALQSGAPDILKNAPVFILAMAGGFTVNCIWCAILNIKNKSYTDYLGLPGKTLGLNFLFAATAGTIWYTGFFFYGMGTTFMGEYDFSSWSIHLAFVIMFSTICGIAMKEWKGVSKKTMALVYLGLVLLLLSTVITAIGSSSAASNEDTAEADVLRIDDLRCEYLKDPLGVDETTPRLSWRLESGERGERQTAYRLLVASARDKLDKDVGDLWDTGKVQSDQSIHVAYAGKPLESRIRCHWKVRVWDKDAKASNWSKSAEWSMGLLKPDDWQDAKWIGIEKGLLEQGKGVRGIDIDKSDDKRTRLPARYLRRDFKVTNKVVRATAYVCGIGFFELHINGRKVGDHVMDPGLTSYDKRAFYVTLDASDYLKRGANCIAVVLANGRYFTPRESKRYSTVENPNQGRISFPKLKMIMRIEYADGKVKEVVSDLDWKVTTDGPIRANNEFDGEEYDGRMEMDGWDMVGFDDSKWKKVESVDAPGGVLQSQMIQPMRIIEVIKPINITNPKPGMYLVDMGQAFYGTVRMKVSGEAGTRIQLRSAYNINPDGILRSRDNRSALSTDVFVLSGKGQEVWSPKFRGQAYRFVEVTGFPGVPKPGNSEGLVIHTDFETHGEFECSNPLINKIFSNVRWTQRAQTRSLPIDPDRDERQGWMGTMAKDMEGYAYNFNMAPVASKWIDDLRLDQFADGHLPDSSPAYWWLYRKSVVWPSNILLTPEVQYDFYADRRLLERNYDTMKKWMTFVSQHLKPDFTTDQNRYGDWVDASTMEENCKNSTKPKWIIDHGETTRPLLTTAYYYNNCKTMARFASLLGKEADQEYFEDLAAKIKKGFNDRFFDPKTNRYGSGTQTSYVLPLAFGMVDDDKRDAVAANLVKDIMITHKEHLSVGTVGMMWLMQTLTDIGYPEVAYTIAAQTTKPSWGYMVSKGATTIWERWDSDTAGPGMNSEGLLILAGNLEAWFYQTLAGINHDPQNPGFKHIILRPNPVGDLTYAKASYKSMYGKIVSDWKITDGSFRWKVTIPPNTTATVYVPARRIEDVTENGKNILKTPGVKFLNMDKNRAVFRVDSGSYEFISKNYKGKQ